MSWLTEYRDATNRTDQLIGKSNHADLLAVGLFGEAGSVFAEIKKKGREMEAYPAYQDRLIEEIGDLLWYLTRLSDILSPFLLNEMSTSIEHDQLQRGDALMDAFALGEAAGSLFRALRQDDKDAAATQLPAIWDAVRCTASASGIDLEEAANRNLKKVRSRWPRQRTFAPLFDDSFIPEEQLPRTLNVEFREIGRAGKRVVLLRCNDLNFGDRLTDNIEHPDFYRYHDVFHFAYAVYLGWSPVVRTLLNCKRKSEPSVDENQDGARARIIEEAVSAIVFSRAKEMKLYEGIDQVDYDLLKTIQEFVRGFEVDVVPLWQWGTAILQGYRVFRSLRSNCGGSVHLDLLNRTLRYQAPA